MSWKAKRQEPDGTVRDPHTGVGYSPEAWKARQAAVEEALRKARTQGREANKGRTSAPRRSSRQAR